MASGQGFGQVFFNTLKTFYDTKNKLKGEHTQELMQIKQMQDTAAAQKSIENMRAADAAYKALMSKYAEAEEARKVAVEPGNLAKTAAETDYYKARTANAGSALTPIQKQNIGVVKQVLTQGKQLTAGQQAFVASLPPGVLTGYVESKTPNPWNQPEQQPVDTTGTNTTTPAPTGPPRYDEAGSQIGGTPAPMIHVPGVKGKPSDDDLAAYNNSVKLGRPDLTILKKYHQDIAAEDKTAKEAADKAKTGHRADVNAGRQVGSARQNFAKQVSKGNIARRLDKLGNGMQTQITQGKYKDEASVRKAASNYADNIINDNVYKQYTGEYDPTRDPDIIGVKGVKQQFIEGIVKLYKNTGSSGVSRGGTKPTAPAGKAKNTTGRPAYMN